MNGAGVGAYCDDGDEGTTAPAFESRRTVPGNRFTTDVNEIVLVDVQRKTRDAKVRITNTEIIKNA